MSTSKISQLVWSVLLLHKDGCKDDISNAYCWGSNLLCLSVSYGEQAQTSPHALTT